MAPETLPALDKKGLGRQERGCFAHQCRLTQTGEKHASARFRLWLQPSDSCINFAQKQHAAAAFSLLHCCRPTSKRAVANYLYAIAAIRHRCAVCTPSLRVKHAITWKPNA